MIRSFAIAPRALALASALVLAPLFAGAEDIDIFTGSSAGPSINPRILIVLDNTSNWARKSQKWPGDTQGQSEVRAIEKVVAELDASVSVGLMEFVTGGTANDDGGFIRYAVREMNDDNRKALTAQLATIRGAINSPDEKRNSNTPYGNLMYDVYNYFAGANSFSPSATLASKADVGGYKAAFSRFRSPLTADNVCGRSYIIFIGNPNSSGPSADTPDNSRRLRELSGAAVPQLGLPNFLTKSVSTDTTVGVTSQCYKDAAAALAGVAEFAETCDSFTEGCKVVPTTAGVCTGRESKYSVVGTDTFITTTLTGSHSTDTGPRNADEWARLLHDQGVPVAGSEVRPPVSTYTVDVYNAQPNAEHTSLLLSMAKAGGGQYYAARNEESIVAALKDIMSRIQAVNTSFASTSLPVNATNRSQNENQVFIGMFRPDQGAKPRWFGNLKRYQLINTANGLDLGDVRGQPAIDEETDSQSAVNAETGFVTPCATSYWTSDTTSADGLNGYWAGMGLTPDPAGNCKTATTNKYSDAPDGPFVEKGGAAQILRQGNVAGGKTNTVNRTMYTESGKSLVTFSTANLSLDTDLLNFIRGEDVNKEKLGGATTRPSIHGDVIHSRPLPVNYGTGGVTVFYGANDGTFRALNAETGVERWAFVAPEFLPRLARLKKNSPLVAYPNLRGDISPAPTPKDYFFDGSTGIYQNADNSRVWVYPTMRRGGRMIYALDVSNAGAPLFKWKAGCPNLSDDSGCTEGMSGIGQTWSTPSVAFIKGYSTTTPVLVVGGGYDRCEDADSVTPNCSATKGGVVYILDAGSGAIIRSFPTERSVAADVSLVDIDSDGFPDYAYAADTGGNLYRIDFTNGPVTRVALEKDAWTSRKVAATSGGGRKFLFAPALFASQGKVYVAIGSGDREHPLYSHYPYANVVNRFYVYKDDLAAVSTPAQNLDALANYTGENSCDTPRVLPNNDLKGWFMSLNQNGDGEQVVTSALIAAGMVTFSTNRPIEPKAGTCSTTLGEARGYWVNLLNAAGAINVPGACGGQRSSTFVGGGLPPSPVLANGVMIGNQATTVVIGAVQKGSENAAGASVAIAPQRVRPTITSKRKRTYSYTSEAR